MAGTLGGGLVKVSGRSLKVRGKKLPSYFALKKISIMAIVKQKGLALLVQLWGIACDSGKFFARQIQNNIYNEE